jgi:glycosyltransferase involved in cell wall biosynthesis
MSASRICAIIPTYNRSLYLRECIESVLAISPPVDEIIVINDGSTDDTEIVAKDYKDRIIYLSKENGGKASALNIALGKCTADYVWICDDDDLAVPDGLAKLKAALDADKTVDVVVGRFLSFRDEDPSRRLFNIYDGIYSDDQNIKIRFLEDMYTSLNAMLVRRSMYSKTGSFREDLIRSQDCDMILRLLRYAKAVEVPETIFLERQHKGIRGSSTDNFSIEKRQVKSHEYGQKIYSKIRAEYSLEEFTPTFALHWDPMLAQRASLIQRAGVFARLAMWKEVIEDFQQACQLSPLPATAEELKLLERTVLSYISWNTLYNNSDWIAGLHDCYAMNKLGQSLVLAICRPLVWQAIEQIKKKNIRHGVQRLKMLVRLLGVKGAVHRGYLSFFKNG